MQASIFRIFLFDDKGQSRALKFSDGLNIITGDSKTGKSAIIEIIDYCLFAKKSTIPKGIITDWTNLYCLIIRVKEKYLVIARNKNSSQIYFNVETNLKFIENFSKEYFKGKNQIDIEDAKKEFEKHIGISVLDTRTSEDEDKRKSGGKITMRSFIPFIFQHQNLIANKHSLFYRFDDFYKRKKTIDDYPILMGWGDANFFNLQRTLESKQKELNQKKKIDEKLKIDNKQLREDLFNSISIYYTIIGKELPDDIDLSELKKLAKDLPLPNINSLGDQNFNEELKKIDNLIFEKNKEPYSVKNLIYTIESNNDVSQNYSKSIDRLKALASIQQNVGQISCPLCEQDVKEINEKILTIKKSNEMLEDEFKKIGIYVNDMSE